MKLKTEKQILMDYMETVLKEHNIECVEGATWLMAKVYIRRKPLSFMSSDPYSGISRYKYLVVPNTLKRFQEWLPKTLKIYSEELSNKDNWPKE